jgi:hypothetical protein
MSNICPAWIRTVSRFVFPEFVSRTSEMVILTPRSSNCDRFVKISVFKYVHASIISLDNWIMQSRKISDVTCRWHKILCSIHFWKVLNYPESPIGIAWLTNNFCFRRSFNRAHQTECCYPCLSDTVALLTSSLWTFFEFALSTPVV